MNIGIVYLAAATGFLGSTNCYTQSAGLLAPEGAN